MQNTLCSVTTDHSGSVITSNAKVIDRESDKTEILVQEAIWKTNNTNWHEGSYWMISFWEWEHPVPGRVTCNYCCQ